MKEISCADFIATKELFTLKMQACGITSFGFPSRSITLKVIVIGTFAADWRGIPLSSCMPRTNLFVAVGR